MPLPDTKSAPHLNPALASNPGNQGVEPQSWAFPMPAPSTRKPEQPTISNKTERRKRANKPIGRLICHWTSRSRLEFDGCDFELTPKHGFGSEGEGPVCFVFGATGDGVWCQDFSGYWIGEFGFLGCWWERMVDWKCDLSAFKSLWWRTCSSVSNL